MVLVHVFVEYSLSNSNKVVGVLVSCKFVKQYDEGFYLEEGVVD